MAELVEGLMSYLWFGTGLLVVILLHRTFRAMQGLPFIPTPEDSPFARWSKEAVLALLVAVTLLAWPAVLYLIFTEKKGKPYG